MIDIQYWLKQFTDELEKTFRERIWFVGLQGSYGRGEATEQSDIDVVVILNTLGAEDVKTYETMLNELPHRDQICGFVSGKDELLNWDAADLFQFYYDTTPIIGRPKLELIKLVKPAEVQILMNAEKIRNGISVDFEEMSETLFEWAKSWLLLNEKGDL